MLRNSGIGNRKRFEDSADPMEGIANLVDVMIVFACGLMVSIVLNWNVDLGGVTKVIDESQLVEIENPEIMDEDSESMGQYQSMGVVVQDPKTGKIYVIKGKED